MKVLLVSLTLQVNQCHNMMLHTYTPLTIVPTKYQLSIPHIFRYNPGQNFKGQGHYSQVKSRSHHDAAHLHPLTNPLQVSTSYTLWLLRY